jgi:hypothetical protein
MLWGMHTKLGYALGLTVVVIGAAVALQGEFYLGSAVGLLGALGAAFLHAH